MSTSQKDPNVIKLNNVRISYPQLFTPKPRSDEHPDVKVFSAAFLLDAVKHADLITQVEKAIERTALDFFKKKVHLAKKCLRDGNEKQDTDGYGDGVMFINSTAQANRRPVVVNQQKEYILEDNGTIAGGDYVNAIIRLYAYDHPKGGKGVSAGLQAIQLVRDAGTDRFGGGKVDVDEEFETISDGGGEEGTGSRRSGRGKASTNPDDF